MYRASAHKKKLLRTVTSEEAKGRTILTVSDTLQYAD